MKKKNVRNRRYSKHIKSKNKRSQVKVTPYSNVDGWEKNLSFTDNLNSLGMNNRGVNEKITEIVQSNQKETKNFIVPEEIDINTLRRLTQQRLDPVKAQAKVKLSIDDEWSVRSLYKKYKDNFLFWEKDHKLNEQQWTRVQCKKKYDSFIKRHGELDKITDKN